MRKTIATLWLALFTALLVTIFVATAQAQSRPTEINIVQTDSNIPVGASASSTYSTNFPVAAAVNGDTSGVGWGTVYPGGNGWNSGNSERYGTSTYTTIFARPYLFKEVITWGLKNDFGTAREPSEGETSGYANRNFKLQRLDADGVTWQDIPAASVTGNLLIINHFVFSEPIYTRGFRVVFDNSGGDGFARLIEIKADAKQ